jgi:hypothetical protein
MSKIDDYLETLARVAEIKKENELLKKENDYLKELVLTLSKDKRK